MRPSWKHRRIVVYATLIFCAAVVLWLTVRGDDTQLAAAIVNGCFILSGGVIGSYVFGAAWDDLNVMRQFGRDAYGAPPRDTFPSGGIMMEDGRVG